MAKLLSLFLTGLISLNIQGQINYKISAEIPSDFPNIKIDMYKGDDIISLPIANGNLNYQGVLSNPDMLVLSIDYDGSGYLGKAIIFATGGDIRLKFLKNKTIEVSGNKDAIDCYYKITVPVLFWNQKVIDLDEKLAEALKNKNADTAAIKLEYINAVDACFQIPQDFIKANPQSITSIQALYYLEQGKDIGRRITLNDLETMYGV
jgi:hypothetical protein